jgi:hypothetical protein
MDPAVAEAVRHTHYARVVETEAAARKTLTPESLAIDDGRTPEERQRAATAAHGAAVAALARTANPGELFSHAYTLGRFAQGFPDHCGQPIWRGFEDAFLTPTTRGRSCAQWAGFYTLKEVWLRAEEWPNEGGGHFLRQIPRKGTQYCVEDRVLAVNVAQLGYNAGQFAELKARSGQPDTPGIAVKDLAVVCAYCAPAATYSFPDTW